MIYFLNYKEWIILHQLDLRGHMMYYYYMNILTRFFKKSVKPTVSVERVDVKRAAERAFEQYKKSYKDLARYDRGEKIFKN